MVRLKFNFPNICGTKTIKSYGSGTKNLLVKILEGNFDTDPPLEHIFPVETPCPAQVVLGLVKEKLFNKTVQLDEIKLVYRGRLILPTEFLPVDVYHAAEVEEDSDLEEEECTFCLWATVFTKEDQEAIEESENSMQNNAGPKSKQMKKRLARLKKQVTAESKKPEDSLTNEESLLSLSVASIETSVQEDMIHEDVLQSMTSLVSFGDQTGELRLDGSNVTFPSFFEEEFDVRAELAKIRCDRWADIFIQEGFSQKRAFAYLTEEVLQASPFFMHKAARRKILLLADMFKRATEKFTENNLLQRINTSKSVESKYTTDGHTFFNNLADLDRAFTQSTTPSHQDSSMQHFPEETPPKKQFSEDTRTLMMKIHRCNTLDSYGVPLEFHEEKENWCCVKHQREVEARIDELARRKIEAAIVMVDSALLEADVFGTGFIPPVILKSIASKAFQECGLALSPALPSHIVDPCFEEGQGLWLDQKMFRQKMYDTLMQEYLSLVT